MGAGGRYFQRERRSFARDFLGVLFLLLERLPKREGVSLREKNKKRAKKQRRRGAQEFSRSFMLERNFTRCRYGQFLVHIFLSYCFSCVFCLFNFHSLFENACPTNISFS